MSTGCTWREGEGEGVEWRERGEKYGALIGHETPSLSFLLFSSAASLLQQTAQKGAVVPLLLPPAADEALSVSVSVCLSVCLYLSLLLLFLLLSLAVSGLILFR